MYIGGDGMKSPWTWRQIQFKLWSDCQGQDMIEYALLVGFFAVAIAAAVPYGVIPVISGVFSKILSVMPTIS